ncbi:MAG TPA: hypothetical protein VGO53_06480 [Steroidobacteraceae bacterium]|nr:hypothetical protein [Steroidobacteraceae bacterium]
MAATVIAALLTLASVAPEPAFAHDGRDNGPAPAYIRNLQPFEDDSGAIATYSTNGRIDTRGTFFKPLGINGRDCSTCHLADQAFSITPPKIRERFEQTNGRDPLFAPVDGANCTNVKRSDRSGHSLLLKHGLIRVAMAVPASSQFSISVVHDPYGCALVADPKTGQLTASVYRRPLPTANLSFLSTVMFDGRETIAPLNNGQTFLANLATDLTHQAVSAINIHFEAVKAPTDPQLAEIVKFETGLFTAQVWDRKAGSLDRHGALGGAWNLAQQTYYPGINDSLGADPSGNLFGSTSMSAFTAWARSNPSSQDAQDDDRSFGFDDRRNDDRYSPIRKWIDRAGARRDIAAGEALFNTAPLTISAVRGLNDNATLGNPVAFQGTCTTCHDSPNVGNHSLPLPLDIGVSHSTLPGLENDPNVANGIAALDEPNLPVFEIKGCASPFSAGQPVSFYTTDPGKALVTGLCSDVNRMKGPVLRGLAARAPYFHNGAAATLLDAVNFYNQRFGMKLTPEQKSQLVAFLNSL